MLEQGDGKYGVVLGLDSLFVVTKRKREINDRFFW